MKLLNNPKQKKREGKRILINYANTLFKKKQNFNSLSGIRKGEFDQVISYSPEDIDTEFYIKNKKILTQQRGDGYWLWKPYFIKKTLQDAQWGDYVFYSDSGSVFINSIDHLISTVGMQQDLASFSHGDSSFFLEKKWTKRDTFILMDCDMPKYYETLQAMASFSLWKKSPFTMQFINEWLSYGQEESIITDTENRCGLPNDKEFVEHRHDQSIFSLLIKKHDLKPYRNPAYIPTKHFLDIYPTSTYKRIMIHYRGYSRSYIRRGIKRMKVRIAYYYYVLFG